MSVAVPFGSAAILAFFDRVMNGVASGDSEAFVGSAVVYGPFHEFGTSRIEARPHFRPAIEALLGPGALQESGDMDLMEALVKGEAIPQLALRLEREIKRTITRKRVLDTGAYRASIATGKTRAQTAARSRARAGDSSRRVGGRW